ncbi:hypothetical protein FPV67DRAFT_268630 [Lyophyllum atratum]|nr:hypothetical protein FPV67DRAFT_268630 [Lyophyllum atratum]
MGAWFLVWLRHCCLAGNSELASASPIRFYLHAGYHGHILSFSLSSCRLSWSYSCFSFSLSWLYSFSLLQSHLGFFCGGEYLLLPHALADGLLGYFEFSL